MNIKEQKAFLSKLAPEGAVVILKSRGFIEGPVEVFVNGEPAIMGEWGFYLPWRSTKEKNAPDTDVGLMCIDFVYLPVKEASA
jgi:hypothetical protein